MGPEDLFLANLPLIERLVRSTCTRHDVPDADREDFASALKLKLIEDDYRVIRQYEGKSSLPTYLYIVIQRFLMDYRDHLWGRWRPSAEARRLGEKALLLEQLTQRDGYSFADACQVIRQKFPEITDANLEELRFALPKRTRRARAVDAPESVLTSVKSERSADDALLDAERAGKASQVKRAFESSLCRLSSEEKLILRMRFASGLKIVTIAHSLQLDQKRLYKTIDRLIATLRTACEAEGLRRDDIAELIEHGAEGIEIAFLTEEPENERRDPSNETAKGATSGASQPE